MTAWEGWVRIGFLLPLLLLMPGVVAADEDRDADLVAALSAFFLEDDPEARAAEGLAIATRWPDARRVAAAIPRAKRWTEDEPGGDMVAWKRATRDGVEHTIYANVPEGYDPKRAWPVLIWLHGGVRRNTDEAGLFGLRALSDASDEEGFILVCPSTQRGAAWWTPNGVDLVRGALRDAAKRWRIDGNRVAVAGFSDGGSGCWHLLTHDPEPYACFMPLMGHPGITRMSGGPHFATNVRSRPVLAVTGGKDRLLPSARAKPMFEELREAGCDFEWLDLPEAEHLLNEAVPLAWKRMRSFWKAHPRKARPAVAWETALPDREGRLDWVEILEVERDDEPAPLPKSARARRLRALGYGLPSGRLEARVAGSNLIEVRTRNVKRFKLHLAAGMTGIDLGRPLKVVVDGHVRFEGRATLDVGYALTEAVRRGPGAPAYVGAVVVEP
jgi:acetyl esterase/lipase